MEMNRVVTGTLVIMAEKAAKHKGTQRHNEELLGYRRHGRCIAVSVVFFFAGRF